MVPKAGTDSPLTCRVQEMAVFQVRSSGIILLPGWAVQRPPGTCLRFHLAALSGFNPLSGWADQRPPGASLRFHLAALLARAVGAHAAQSGYWPGLAEKIEVGSLGLPGRHGLTLNLPRARNDRLAGPLSGPNPSPGRAVPRLPGTTVYFSPAEAGNSKRHLGWSEGSKARDGALVSIFLVVAV